MKLYRLGCDTSYRCLCWDNESPATDRLEGEFVRQFRTGEPITKWIPPPIRFMTIEEEIEAEPDDESISQRRIANGISDCPFYSAAVMFFSGRAMECLGELLGKHGQFLPVPMSEQRDTFYVFNCTTVIDALDRQRSDIEFYSSGTPRTVRKYVFYEEVIGDTPIFRLSWPQTYALYVSEAVVQKITQTRLKGFIASEL